MTIRELLKHKNMTVYRLAKESGISYATVNDICNGKAKLLKCSAETVYKIAHVLDVTMEELLEPYFLSRTSFENFKSNVCHQLKNLGDLDFVIETLKSEDIRKYYDRKWYPESLYLLAMLDYISRINNIPLTSEYDDIRKSKLEKPIYPAGIMALYLAAKDDSVLNEAVNSSIPEFIRFNIVESEVRNVI